MASKKEIYGRWLETIGLALVVAGIIGYPIQNVLYWYYVLAGAVVAVIGSKLYVK
jgi:ribose/xylose/arabinose/galactoside ABC-type transport system permease subunit